MILTTEKSVRFTRAQYEKAIEDLRSGMEQLAPDGLGCAICTDSGHQAWECAFNPLRAMAICGAIAKQSEALHESLHWLAGYETWMGERQGPSAIVMPEAGDGD